MALRKSLEFMAANNCLLSHFFVKIISHGYLWVKWDEWLDSKLGTAGMK